MIDPDERGRDERKDRRSFLIRTMSIVPAAALSTTACTKQTPATSPAEPPQSLKSAPPYRPVFFNSAEWSFVLAAVARLIPSDDVGPGAIETDVPQFIDRQMDALFGHASTWYMQGPFVESAPEFGYQGKLAPRDVYRAGIEATDAHCRKTFDGKTFAALGEAEQDAVLKGLEDGSVQFDVLSAKTFFGFLLQNTKEGYLSDPMHGGNKDAAAWAMIGFPGARADFADWVGRPGVRYPLPPVSIDGPQG